MKLAINGVESCGKQTRHFSIEYFFITDLIKLNEVEIWFCPSNEMTADFMTKSLVGKSFIKQGNKILNE